MKTVLITGASRGIGAACAKVFAEDGYAVVVNYKKSEEKAKALCKSLQSAFGVETMAVRADVSKKDEVDEMARQVKERFGGLDALVNNAGIAQQKLFCDTTPEEWDRMIATNLSSVYLVSRAFLPEMIRRHSGSIVNIASMWGEVGGSCEVAYSAAKAGVIGLTKALAKELGPSSIRVNCVSPGVVMTDMMRDFDAETLESLKEETPLLRLGTPEDVARAVKFFCSDESGFVTGQVLSVSGGMVI